MKWFTNFAAATLLVGLAVAGSARGQDLAPFDPIGDVADQMKVAVSHLAKLNTGALAKTAQQEALRKLDVLIEELEKQAESGKGNSGANPQKPLNKSVIMGGPGGSGALHAARPDGKQWGELPPHERDRILQSLTEGFPAHYQVILERYYKRLAEEKSASTGEEAPPAKEGAMTKPNDAKSSDAKPNDTKPAAAPAPASSEKPE